MKTFKSLLIAALLALGAFATSAAQAHPGHFYGPRVGVYVDPWAVFYPWATYPYGYGYYGYPQVVVTQPAAPTVYVEREQQPAPQTVAPAQQSSDWYYCRKPQGYYPYVRSCSEAWQRVPAQPPVQQ
jgi:hypothetical protein